PHPLDQPAPSHAEQVGLRWVDQQRSDAEGCEHERPELGVLFQLVGRLVERSDGARDQDAEEWEHHPVAYRGDGSADQHRDLGLVQVMLPCHVQGRLLWCRFLLGGRRRPRRSGGC
ncbi:unnamed protein product, partial [Linum tenue]